MSARKLVVLAVFLFTLLGDLVASVLTTMPERVRGLELEVYEVLTRKEPPGNRGVLFRDSSAVGQGQDT